MSVLLLVFGILLLLLGIMESLWTTIWVDGNSSPLSSRLTTGIWKFMRLIISNRRNKTLSLAGPIILVFTVLFWVLLIWFGWVLIFYSFPQSLLVKNTSSLPDFSDVWWYVGYNLFTVGNGDFVPKGNFWQVMSSFISFSGMSMVTLSITYIFQVVSAVTNKRSFASEVMSIGTTAEEFVRKQWTGENFGAMELQLSALTSQLSRLSEQHMAFPILHYYHAAEPSKSMDIAIAILDDALTTIKYGMKSENLPPETILSSSRNTIDSFLTTMKGAFIHPASKSPPEIQLTKLKKANVPVIEDEGKFQEAIKGEEKRRKLILGLLDKGAHKWPE